MIGHTRAYLFLRRNGHRDGGIKEGLATLATLKSGPYHPSTSTIDQTISHFQFPHPKEGDYSKRLIASSRAELPNDSFVHTDGHGTAPHRTAEGPGESEIDSTRPSPPISLRQPPIFSNHARIDVDRRELTGDNHRSLTNLVQMY